MIRETKSMGEYTKSERENQSKIYKTIYRITLLFNLDLYCNFDIYSFKACAGSIRGYIFSQQAFFLILHIKKTELIQILFQNLAYPLQFANLISLMLFHQWNMLQNMRCLSDCRRLNVWKLFSFWKSFSWINYESNK